MSDLIEAPKRTSELVVERMEALIREGEWPVGSRIPAEPELVQRFGVGRNSIREAVRALEHAGLLAPRRGDGTYVRSANLFVAVMTRGATTELLDLLQVRRALETEAASAAASAASPRGVRTLRGLLESAESAFGRGDFDQYDQIDIDFHAAVVAASGNALLVDIYGGVLEVMRSSHAEITARLRSSATHPIGHRDLVEAIEAGDPAAAAAAVHSYLSEAESGLLR
ncbi:GntR family transcriptional regulator [Flexivirga endophytica]|uniref:GntR family transcriptional regulator n=1 Tax=Flexivirga endophytica TaxID=1849103 RepID=A0A916TI27_9MICO|nr:FCD domain-containing protein [Flexivirga endophytica]GGB46569.1 GntR family transcriptional regulator [Flexivirga endophytica]GHB70260.1 GntR family transcriptional regulator [Flexivirga endophytica]